jgi:hypothetical protein
MIKASNWAARATMAVASLSFAVLVGAVARAQDKVQLTGQWSYNQVQSDDAQKKVDDARQNSKTQRSGGGGYPGGGYPGGGMGRIGLGIPGIGGIGGGRGGRSRQGSSVSSQEWDRLAADPEYLRIDQRSDQVVVIDDSHRAQTFYPDGKKHDDKDPNGNKISTQASWQGGAFVAETKLPQKQRLTQTFRVSDDGKQLYLISQFEAPSLNGPLSIRRVFDFTKTTAQAK